MKKDDMAKTAASAPASGQPWTYSPSEIATAQVNKLKRSAFAGDAKAASELVYLADCAASAVFWIWEGIDLDLVSPDFEKKREFLREILRRIAGERETWPVLWHCRGAKREETEQMVRQLNLGTATPLKAKGVKDSDMRQLIVTLSYDIGVPSRSNIKEWPDKALDRIHTSDGMSSALRNPRTWLYGLANPRRQVEKRRQRSRGKLEEWEKKTRREHKSGELSTEEIEKKKKWLKKIDDRKVTDAELKNGLKEAIAASLKSLIPERPQI